MFTCSSLYIFIKRYNILVTKFCLTIDTKLIIIFHQSSKKIGLKKTTSVKINTLRKPKKNYSPEIKLAQKSKT